LRPNTKLIGLTLAAQGGYSLRLENKLSDETAELNADLVVLCTGYRYRMPEYLAELAPRIPLDRGNYRYNRDFSIKWDGPPGHKVYVQNAARSARGIADPNLSLMAWRSANIVNGLLGRPHYCVHESKDLKLWD
jgi:lysine N6-hydroxylase